MEESIKFTSLLQDYLTFSAKKSPEKMAIIQDDDYLTYKMLDNKSDQLALALINRGLKRQDRVLVFLDNSLETVISIFGILKAGGIFVNLSSGLKPNKLSYIINDTKTGFIISHANKLQVLSAGVNASERLIKSIIMGEIEDKKSDNLDYIKWNEIINSEVFSKSDQLYKLKLKIVDDDLAAIIYTSGSTGEPKGIMCPHFNMLSVAKSIISYLQNNSEDIILNLLPLSFGYGLYQILVSVIVGSTVVLDKSFMFPVKILSDIEKYKITGVAIVPTIAVMLLNVKDISQYNLNSLKYITNAGGALSAKNLLLLKKLFNQTKIYSMYGLTECQRVSYLPPEEIEKHPSSVGIPMPNCDVLIVNEKGEKVEAGKVGELVIRGTNLMRGYWNSPELTNKVFKEDINTGKRYLFSGDLFHIDDDGYLYFHGRKDDLIKTKGERVSPKEIENLLNDLEEVAESAVVGVPDEILGSALKAFIVLKSEKNLVEKDIQKYCQKNLENFMVPKYVEFVNELPKNHNGKLDRKNLNKLEEIF